MMSELEIREVRPEECVALGQLLVEAYASLEGFPTPAELPAYYEMLANIGSFTEKKDARVLVALSEEGELVGGVVYFGDMAEYSNASIATTLENASGMRLLGVSVKARGQGVGKALTQACIQQAREKGHAEMILHSTHFMPTAWGMYERMGFQRSDDLNFQSGDVTVFGFRLRL